MDEKEKVSHGTKFLNYMNSFCCPLPYTILDQLNQMLHLCPFLMKQ